MATINTPKDIPLTPLAEVRPMEVRQPLSVNQTARVLGIHPDTVRDYCDRGLIVATRTAGGPKDPTGHRRIAWIEIERFLANAAQRAHRAA